jgi:tRNA(adenine34) deaminase
MDNGQLAIDKKGMQQALDLARHAEALGEIPVGAVLVLDNDCIGEGWNQPIASRDPSSHAEIVALRQAARKADNYRLPETTLYVTLEPCPMCAGALVHARVQRVVFGTTDPNSGAGGSVFNILNSDRLNHRIDITGGILQDECSHLLQTFFKQKSVGNP